MRAQLQFAVSALTASPDVSYVCLKGGYQSERRVCPTPGGMWTVKELENNSQCLGQEICPEQGWMAQTVRF